MNLTAFLKNQLQDFIEVYQKFLFRTFGIALTYTIFCFVAIAVLLRFSDFDTSTGQEQMSILSFIFARYSYGEIYSIVDLAKSILLFFIALFSLGLIRNNPDKQKDTEISMNAFIKKISLTDIFYLIGALVLCAALDFVLFQLDRLSLSKVSHKDLDYYLSSLIFLFRIYIPLIIFGLTTFRLTSGKKLNLNFKTILFLFISLWIFNEFAYEFFMLIRIHIFGLLLLPFRPENQFFAESFIGLLLIAFYFLGYHSAMWGSLKFLEDKKALPVNKGNEFETTVNK